MLFPRFDADLASLEQRLRERAAGETVLDAFEAWFAAFLEPPDTLDDREPVRRRIVATNASLVAFERGLMRSFEDMLREAFAHDLDTPPYDSRLVGLGGSGRAFCPLSS